MGIIGNKETVVGASGSTGVYNTAVLSDGGWVTTWTTADTTWGYGVVQQVYNADGSARTQATRITPDTRNGSGDFPSVTALDNGGWVVTYLTGYNQMSTLVQQIFDADGMPQGEPAQIATGVGGPSYYGSRNVLLSDGGWAVFWSDGDTTYQRAFNADGTPKGSATEVHEGYTEPPIIALSDGGFVATWVQVSSVYSSVLGQDVYSDHVFQQSYNADGTKRGSEVRVDQIGLQVRPEALEIVALANGGWVVTWTDVKAMSTENGSSFGVYQRAFNADGAPKGGEMLVNSFTEGEQWYQEVEALTDGGWVVVWQSIDQDHPGYDLFQQVYNADGTKRGQESRVNTEMQGDQRAHTVTALSEGGWVVTWHTQLGTGYQYYQQVFNADGSRNGKEMQIEAGWERSHLNEVVALPDGSWIITWHSSDSLSNLGWQGTVTQTQYRLNENPVARNLTASTAENKTIAIDVLSSATDKDGDTLTIVSASAPAGFGTASVDKNGLIVYDPKSKNLAAGETREVAIAYTVTDAYGGEANGKITVTVVGVNDAPVISSNGGRSSAQVTIKENKTTVTTVKAADPEKNKLTYSISGGADKALFKIDSKTGNLYFIKAPDFENPTDKNEDNVYEVVVKASDGISSDTQTIRVTVVDVKGEVLNGTSGSDVLYGGIGDDVIDGKGSADIMRGGIGDDTYFVNNVNDKVIEKADQGTDLVIATVSYALANTHVENLTLAGTKAINGTGNNLANTITGNSADNVLDGKGGADTLIGGKGNDTYIVDNAKDKVVEKVDQGVDLVKASVSYSLSNTYVENLTLTGSKAINGNGNSLANVIIGNSSDNKLDGGKGNDTLDGGAGNDRLIGGIGADHLYGGAGKDAFVFRSIADSLTKSSGRDTIHDFAKGDRIDLREIDSIAYTSKDDAFSFIGKASFSATAGELRIDKKSSDTYVYGDVDGDGKADFAILVKNTSTLTSGDFML